MKNLVLISDNNHNDIYTSALKYHITAEIKDIHIFDYFLPNNSRKIYNTAAYLLLNEHHFTDNTVFYIETNFSQNTSQQKILIIQYNHKWIISPDNGIAGLIEKNKIQNIFYWKDYISTGFYSKNEMLDALKSLVSANFSTNKYFTPIQINDCHKLIWENTIERIISDKEKKLTVPVLFVDSYGNVILNFKKSDYEKYKDNYEIKIEVPFHTITHIDTAYNMKKNGDVMAIFNDANYLEILVVNGNFFNLIIPKDMYEAGNYPTILITLTKKQ